MRDPRQDPTKDDVVAKDTGAEHVQERTVKLTTTPLSDGVFYSLNGSPVKRTTLKQWRSWAGNAVVITTAKNDGHVKGCELGINWKDCPACVDGHNATCKPCEKVPVPGGLT